MNISYFHFQRILVIATIRFLKTPKYPPALSSCLLDRQSRAEWLYASVIQCHDSRSSACL